MNKDYNKEKHHQLLKYSEDLRKQGKDLYRENRNEYMELLHYRGRLEDHAFWKNRKQFVLLMDNLIYGLIDMEKFEITFSRLWEETLSAHSAFQMDLKRVENLQLDPRSDGFGSLITSVYRQFEVLEDEECTEQEVKDYVQNMLQKIQPYL
jgi:hypothetical protein